MFSIEKKIRQIFDINKNDDRNKEIQIHKSFKKNLYETNQNPRQNEFLKYIKDKEFKFDEDWLTYKTNIMLNIFDSFNFKPKNILEIGVNEGFSTIFFQYAFDNFETNVVDIFPNNTRKIFEKNINKINSKKINIFATTSHKFLVNNKKKYDLIFVDGAHGYLDVIVDLFYSYQSLNINGILLMDDYDWKEKSKDRSVRLAINNFLDIVENTYNTIHYGSFAAIIKKNDITLNQKY